MLSEELWEFNGSSWRPDLSSDRVTILLAFRFSLIAKLVVIVQGKSLKKTHSDSSQQICFVRHTWVRKN